MIYSFCLSPAIDYCMELPAFCEGELNRSSGEYYSFGGKGINVARVLRELGAKSTVLGFAGGFTGKALQNGLRELGIASELIFVKNGATRINVKLKGIKETEINGKGPTVSADELSVLTEKLEVITENDFAVLSGSIPAGLPKSVYGDICKCLSEKGVPFAVDAEGELLLYTLPYRPLFVKPNRDELKRLFGSDDIDESARRLLSLGAQIAVVSLGADGVALYTENEKLLIAAYSGKAVNTVGAGDSLVAGFLYGLIKGKSLGEALALGNAAGAATAFSKDLCTRSDIEKLYGVI